MKGPYKKRVRPWQEGSLRKLYEIFIVPLLKHKPKDANIQDYLEGLFCVDTRLIKRYIVKEPFKIPGIYCEAAYVYVPGVGARDTKIGDEIWIRIDTHMGRVDLEYFGGQGGKDQWFMLDYRQFETIQVHLEEKPFKSRRQRRFSWEIQYDKDCKD